VAIKKSLTDLKLDYLDLYLIHWPVALKPGVGFPQSADEFLSPEEAPMSETWKEMEKAVKQGMIRHIGVSNFGIKRLKEMMSYAEIKPEMNQVEAHPYFQQSELFQFCRNNGIHVTAYSPLGSPDRPEGMKAANEPSLLENPVIVKIAEEKGCSPGQVLITWALQRGMSVIPKSVNPKRIAENLKAKSIELSTGQLERIKALDKDYRYVTGEFWVAEGGPYTMDNIWD
jgi:alcohol dehydrogenase (NADP+)